MPFASLCNQPRLDALFTNYHLSHWIGHAERRRFPNRRPKGVAWSTLPAHFPDPLPPKRKEAENPKSKNLIEDTEDTCIASLEAPLLN